MYFSINFTIDHIHCSLENYLILEQIIAESTTLITTHRSRKQKINGQKSLEATMHHIFHTKAYIEMHERLLIPENIQYQSIYRNKFF